MSTDTAVLMSGQLAAWVAKGAAPSAATLSYEDSYARDPRSTPLSLSMPLHVKSHEAGDWLDGLLPPSAELRQQIGRAHGAQSQHPVDLLATEVGLDCAGAIQFVSADLLGTQDALRRASGRDVLSSDDMQAGLAALKRGAIAWEQAMGRPLSFSLSGAQTKVALYRGSDGEWSLPYGNTASTHILKIELPSFPDNVIVEHLCMTALRTVGIPAARTEVVEFGDERAIAVERYDRSRRADQSVARRHQEDLCQATGTASHRKQQWAGGPAPARIAELLWHESDTGDACVRRFADALIANWVLLATDAHAKNYGVLLQGSTARLAPLYDVCSEAPWRPDPEIAFLQMAMKCGQSFDAMNMGRAEWAACASALSLPPHEVMERVESLCTDLPRAVVGAAENLPHDLCSNPRVERLVAVMQQRPASCAEILSPSGSGNAG